MDCPSEENLIRMKLANVEGIKKIESDIRNRRITVFHKGDTGRIEELLAELGLGSEKISEENKDTELPESNMNGKQQQILLTVLLINAAFFAIEIATGLISHSMGLVADSLDMLADALVYGLSLFAVGKTVTTKKNVAKAAGYFQIVLALTGLTEVIRRFFTADIVPDPATMIVVSALALIANGICLYLLQRMKDGEAHIQASLIFTSNDVIINTGVILAGLLVMLLQSAVPDLVIGIVVFAVVIGGASRILKLAK